MLDKVGARQGQGELFDLEGQGECLTRTMRIVGSMSKREHVNMMIALANVTNMFLDFQNDLWHVLLPWSTALRKPFGHEFD